MDNQQVNPKKLFVGNLSYGLSEDQLREAFAEYGEITDLTIITDRYSGRSKGFGFIEFATEEQAQAAVDGLNEQELDGRKLLVNVARPPKPRRDRGGFDR